MEVTNKKEYTNKRVTKNNIIDLYTLLLKCYEERKDSISFSVIKYSIVTEDNLIFSGNTIKGLKDFFETDAYVISVVNMRLYSNDLNIDIQMQEKKSIISYPIVLEVKADSEISNMIFGEFNVLIERFKSNSFMSTLRKRYVISLPIIYILIYIALIFIFNKYVTTVVLNIILVMLSIIISISIFTRMSYCFSDVEFDLSDKYISISKKERKKVRIVISILGLLGTILTIISFVFKS